MRVIIKSENLFAPEGVSVTSANYNGGAPKKHTMDGERYFVPASSMRGILRHSLSNIVKKSLAESTGRGLTANEILFHDVGYQIGSMDLRAPELAVTPTGHIFGSGSPFVAGRLFVEDAVFIETATDNVAIDDKKFFRKTQRERGTNDQRAQVKYAQRKNPLLSAGSEVDPNDPIFAVTAKREALVSFVVESEQGFLASISDGATEAERTVAETEYVREHVIDHLSDEVIAKLGKGKKNILFKQIIEACNKVQPAIMQPIEYSSAPIGRLSHRMEMVDTDSFYVGGVLAAMKNHGDKNGYRVGGHRAAGLGRLVGEYTVQKLENGEFRDVGTIKIGDTVTFEGEITSWVDEFYDNVDSFDHSLVVPVPKPTRGSKTTDGE